MGSEINSGDLFKSAVSKPGQNWDDDVVKEPEKMAEYATKYHQEISIAEAGKGFQNLTGLHVFFIPLIYLVTCSLAGSNSLGDMLVFARSYHAHTPSAKL